MRMQEDDSGAHDIRGEGGGGEGGGDVAVAAGVLGEAGFACGPVCPDAATARALLPAAQPDIVLMDIDLGGTSGIECVRNLRPHLPQTHFVKPELTKET